MSDKFAKLQKYQKIRSRMAVCPIIKQKVMVTSLTVGDDINIRTMIANPDMYDSEISVMLHNHTTFVDFEEQPTYEDFVSNISHSDRKMLLWAIYTATYKVIKQAEIVCPHCSHGFKQDISVDDLMTDSTVHVWQEDKPFSTFVYQTEVELDGEDSPALTVHMVLPTIKDHLDVLKTISAEVMRHNFERFESVMTKTDELVLMIKSIDIVDSDGTDSLTELADVRHCIDHFLPLLVQEQLISDYNGVFDKYNPTFTYSQDCPGCSKNISFDIDIETMLFKRFLNP